MTKKRKHTILYIESGSSGKGGSYVSLLQLLTVFSNNYELHVLLWNDSPFIMQYQELGAHVVKIDNPIYTVKKSRLKKLYNAATALFSRTAPRMLIGCELLLQYSCYRKVLSYVKKNSITLIHLNNQPIRNFIGFWLAKTLNLPVVSHLRTLNGYGMTPAHINFLKRLRCRMVAPSHSASDYWQKAGVPLEWISVLPNPYYEEPGFRPLLNDVPATRPTGYSLVCISRLEEGKGLFFLIAAFRELLKSDSQFTLTLIGDGILREKLQQEVERYQLNNHVSFLGYVHDAKRLLPHYNLLIFVSEREGFGRVAVEGMAAGIPVVASKVSGIVDVVQDQYNGLLVDYGDIPQLTSAVLSLQRDPALREKLIENGRRTVNDRYGLSAFRTKMETVYESFFAGNSA